MTIKLAALLGMAFAAAVLPIAAHHSFAAEYDASKAIRITGVISKVEWTNPHSYLYIDVKDEQGQPSTWTCEGGAPNALSRRGFTQERHQARRHRHHRRLWRQGRIALDGRAAHHAERRPIFYSGSPGDGGPGDPGKGRISVILAPRSSMRGLLRIEIQYVTEATRNPTNQA